MMIARRLLTLLMLVGAPGASLAQGPRRAIPQPQGLGSIRGVVYDSLIRAPLEGAMVSIVGGSTVATTDASGRFRLDSIPAGRVVLTFEHPDLDSAGLSSNARRITVEAGRPTVVELDVPSLGTLYRVACGAGGVAHAASDSGFILGAVLDVRTRARLAGARVDVHWVTARVGGQNVEVSRPGVSVTTDSLGNYYACGIPTEYIVTVSAQAGRFVSGKTEALLGTRGVTRRDLGVSRDSGSLAADSGAARRGRATLMGSVLDEHDNPRPGARVSIDDASGETFSDERGRFVLANQPPGSQTAMVRMIGYSASRMAVMLRDGDTTRIAVRVRALTVLDTIRVTSRAGNAVALDELEARLRGASGAFVLRGEDIKRRPSMRSVFQALPTLHVEGRSSFDFTLTTLHSGRYEPVSIYVDGFPATTESVQSYRPDQIIAVEFFPRGALAPIRFQSLTDGAVLLVWTRFIR